MTAFEQFLIKKGYIKYIFDCSNGRLNIAKGHTISTMVNLDHRYIHESNKTFIDKINKGFSVFKDEFTKEELWSTIIFGLNERHRPPTLISPRPTIKLKKIVKDSEGGEYMTFETQDRDDAMNIILDKIDFETIFKAMYDYSIVINVEVNK